MLFRSTGAQNTSSAELTFPMERVQLTDIRCTPHMDPAQDWARILAVTPKVNVLEIHSELLRDNGSRSILPSSFLSVLHLKLRSIIRLADVLDFLATVLRPGCLTSVEAKILMPEHLSALSRFLSSDAACELQHLHLDFSRFRHSYFRTFIVDMTFIGFLRALTRLIQNTAIIAITSHSPGPVFILVPPHPFRR